MKAKDLIYVRMQCYRQFLSYVQGNEEHYNVMCVVNITDQRQQKLLVIIAIRIHH